MVDCLVSIIKFASATRWIGLFPIYMCYVQSHDPLLTLKIHNYVCAFFLQIWMRSSDAAANSITAARIKDGTYYVWRQSVIKPVKKMRTLSRTYNLETWISVKSEGDGHRGSEFPSSCSLHSRLWPVFSGSIPWCFVNFKHHRMV